MKELERITQLWSQVKNAGGEAVLATVVKTRGSSYRSPGARLLLTQTGQRAGSISGGCLEEELVRKAWWFTENGPVVRRYDTTADGEIASGYGLGCNGIIHVLLERVTAAHCEALDVISRVLNERRPAVLTHIISPAVGEEVEVFTETLTPPTRLLIFGAGDDTVPVTQLARYLGWQAMVFDGRAHYARPEKFPEANLVKASSADELDLDALIDPWTVAVLMTHSYTQDLEALQRLSSRPLAYLGILGPRKRSLQLISDAGLERAETAAAIHSPMGLDIGAEGPEQVALSVISEIQAVLKNRNGGSLADRGGPIHSREELEQDSFVRSIACV